MVRVLDEDELVGNWTLVGEELDQLSGRRGATKLGFALLLRFYAVHGRFPAGRAEIPEQAVAYVARLVDVLPSELGLYEWDGRTIKAHRGDIRRYFGFRECSLADADKAADWLAVKVCDKERQADRVRAELLAYLREERIEPPARDRIRRIIGTALRQAEQSQTAQISGRIPAEAILRLLALIAKSADPGGEAESQAEDDGALFGVAEAAGVDVFAVIREEPGNVSVKTIEREVFKLTAIRAVGLPDDVFADVAPKVLAAWRARVAAEAPSHLRSHPHDIKVTLLAAYLHCRAREITDTLVDLLISTVHRINARADTKVTSDFVAELKRVSGKENILFKMTEAALESPESRVEDVIYPAVPGGYTTLISLLHEFKAKGTSYRQHKQRVFKASYTNHYRTGLIQILEVLEFGSTNTVHAPMMQALTLIKRYKAEQSNRVKCYALGEIAPVEGIVPAELVELMYRADGTKRRRILRSVYECGVFQTLREKLRCKEIWVVGADRWRNPDDDLPKDFETRRAENYANLRKPLDPQVFIDQLRSEMDAELSALNDALGGRGLAWLKIAERRNAGAIQLSPLDAAPEPRNLRRLKTAIRDRWGVVPLMDMLTETCLRTGCLNVFTPAGTQNHLDAQVLFERLLLLIYAYGTGTGIRAVAASDHPHTEDDLRYARRRYLTVEACREVARIIANATFAVRQAALWGEGTTAVASDSTHFSAFDQNIFTEWHSRYRRAKRGVLIYWTVETGGSMAVHSQLISCSASEVHAMVEGAMRHGTDMEIEQNFVDSHGASFVGFGIIRLLDFDLVARFKQINKMKLYLPGRGDFYDYPLLAPALTRPIKWDIIANNYDLMMKYATAIRLRTASTEALLRRFTSETTHPAYAAMLEVGRVQRTIFLARWLRDRDLQRETESGLNVVENYNGVNDYIKFGKRGELASNRREEQELGMLCLHILQSCLGLINTLMIQDTLALPEWEDVLTDIDRRGLTPLFHTNMTPYGEIQLRTDRRLDLTNLPAAGP
ncbi:Tn3 family transposase [Microbispora bryophytorum]|uniref:Tn3 family transposase n=1 Tax=Microbispora bryophytorum TaxID=1460882 RepID=UPI0033FDAF3B